MDLKHHYQVWLNGGDYLDELEDPTTSEGARTNDRIMKERFETRCALLEQSGLLNGVTIQKQSGIAALMIEATATQADQIFHFVQTNKLGDVDPIDFSDRLRASPITLSDELDRSDEDDKRN
jgi:hypothetical protein